ncbi:RHS repeat domain-containing protein [Pseudomonas sp. XS1P51]
MQPRLSALHRNTPKMMVVEPRGLAVRAVDYYRGAVDEPIETRINHTTYDPLGRAIARRDPRLFQDVSAPANLSTIHSLGGIVLRTVSVDAGLRLSLFGSSGQLVCSWDGRGARHRMQYDNQLRLTALFEQAAEGDAICAEHLGYAANDQVFVEQNQCGRLIRHHDPAGIVHFKEYALTGVVLEQTRHFLAALTPPDWSEPVADCELLLEPGEGATTRSRFNPTGDLIEQIDARINRQYFSQTIAGQLREVRLQLSGDSTLKTLASAIQYNAEGKVEQETAGNRVITRLYYQPEDGRLVRLLSCPDQKDPLLDLNYTYDPVGNVLGIRDAVQPIHYFANQRVDSTNQFVYDSLYRLIEASGSERGSHNKGPVIVEDPLARANYRQTYRYDLGENLLELTHEGPQDHGHRLIAARHSNRCLPVLNGLEPSEEDFRDGFDASGNALQLQPGQTLSWNARNQLQQVQPVVRSGGLNDRERYIYGADGMRVRKVSETHTGARTVVAEVRYLGTLELRIHSGTGETLHVINIQAGYGTTQVLHWETETPKGMANDACRYSVPDHLGSCSLELDSQARVISRETYHPFGATASCDSGDSSEESRRTQRYSGKERDATGLYYYGLRYYMPWQQRWLNPDPAGYVDGNNLLAFVSGNPLSYKDEQGTTGIDVNALTSEQRQAIGIDGPKLDPVVEVYKTGFGLTSAPTIFFQGVDDQTYTSLEQVRAGSLITKTLLRKGSPNQVLDLMRSIDDPADMVYMLSEVVRKDINPLGSSLRFGIGNCGEHADVLFNLLASTETHQPVVKVSAGNGVDHAFVVIGDYREPQGRNGKIIVADAWPTFPLPHLADVGMFEVGNIKATAPAAADPRYQLDDALLVENGEVVFPDVPPDGRVEQIRRLGGTYLQLFSVQDSQRGLEYYSFGRSGGFNKLPERYVVERMNDLSNYMKGGMV